MKKIILFVTILIATLLSSCDGYGLVFDISNRTEEEITIVLGYKDERNDTTIILNEGRDNLSTSMGLYNDIQPNDIITLGFLGEWKIQEKYCDKYIKKEYHGLLRMFIVKTKDVENYGWKEVVEKDMVLQRYDFTDADLMAIDRQVYFPPTPSMVNISMWPPYGTYPTGLPQIDESTLERISQKLRQTR